MVKLLNLNGAVFNLLDSVLFFVNFCDNDIFIKIVWDLKVYNYLLV